MRKMFKICVCGLVIAAVATGCSKKGADETTAATVTAETTAAVESTAAGTAADGAQTADPIALVDLAGIDNGTITLGDYKGIEVTKEVSEVTTEEVDAQVKTALDSNPEFLELDRAAQDGDIVNINYVGTKDGVAFEGGSAENFDFTIGTTNFIDGFKEGILGSKKGEEKTLNLTFPAEYPQNPDLAGQPVEFKVTINTVKEKKDAQLNDAFVQRISESKTVDEYKESLKEELLTQKETQAEQKFQSDLLTKIVDGSKIETTQEAIDANYNNYVVNYTNQASMYGMDLNTLASAFFGMEGDAFKEELKKMADSAVKQRLVFNAVAEKETITVSDDDRIGLAVEMGYESKDKMVESVGTYTVDDYIISTKVMDFLVANAVVK